jgi:protein O-mannosyl-transferase
VGPRLFSKLAVCVVLLAITWAVFGQTLGYGFVNYDDPAYVSENRQIQGGLSWTNIEWAFTHIHSHNWHPLTTISHMLDCQIFGLNPAAHHFVNILLHSASAILLFVLLEQMTTAFWRSAFVAAVFAVHPLHVESVAWISERKDVLSGFFFMLTLLAYVHYTRKPNVVRYASMSILFLCGLLSKPMLVTTPAVLLLLDYWPLKRVRSAKGEARSSKAESQGQSGKRETEVAATTQHLNTSTSDRVLVVEKIPLFALSLGSAIATIIAQRGGVLQGMFLPFTWRLANAASAYLIYVRQMFWPVDLAVIYPHPGRLPLWETTTAAAMLILVTTLVFVLRKRRPYLMTGWFWYTIMLIPVLGLIQVGSQAHADRYAYLPGIGLFIAIGWSVSDLVSTLRYRLQVWAVVVPCIIGALGWRAWIQTGYWRDTERLWDRTLAVTGQNDFAHFGLGEFLLKGHRLDDAIAQFKIVLANHPNDPDANFQIGYAFMETGDVDAAISHFEQSLKVKPDNPDAETNLGNLLLKSGRIDDAVKHYRIVVAREPSSALAHYNLAVGLHRLGRLPEAIVQYKETLSLDPKYPDAEEFLRQAQFQNGETGEPNQR